MENLVDKHPIRVLLVDNSPLALKVLEAMLAGAADIEVVGVAKNGRDALAQIERLHPAVVCTGTQLSGMSGLELTREIMSQFPTPILVMGSSHRSGEAELHAALLEAGAVDVFELPRSLPAPSDPISAELVTRIKRLSRVPVISRTRKNLPPALESKTAQPRVSPGRTSSPRTAPLGSSANQLIVAIGASTGGPQAVLTVLSALPADYPYPVLCVQHISKGFLTELLEWLDDRCALNVIQAQENESALPGHVYFPSEDHHLQIDTRGRLHLVSAPAVGGHRPSITTTFESLAQTYGSRSVAVLLTGMGSDGALGLKAVYDVGGQTYAQDEASCVVFGMPKQAISLGAAQHILPPGEIAQELVGLAGAKEN